MALVPRPVQHAKTAVGRHQLLGEAHKASVGGLWLARAESVDAIVAVRRVALRPPLGPSDLDAVEEVARWAVELEHACIVGVIEVLRDEDELAIVQVHREGDLLRGALRAAALGRTPVPAAVALRVALDLCDALEFLNSRRLTIPRGSVFGGLTPDSVLLGADGGARLLEPGIASLFGGAVDLGGTLPPGIGVLALDPKRASYQSPEQLEGGELDARSDVFSLGVLLWETVRNRALYTGSTRETVAKQIRHTRAPRADATPPPGGSPVSQRVADVIEKALELDPANRFASFGDLAAAIRATGAATATASDVKACVEALCAPALKRQRDLARSPGAPRSAARPVGMRGALPLKVGTRPAAPPRLAKAPVWPGQPDPGRAASPRPGATFADPPPASATRDAAAAGNGAGDSDLTSLFRRDTDVDVPFARASSPTAAAAGAEAGERRGPPLPPRHRARARSEPDAPGPRDSDPLLSDAFADALRSHPDVEDFGALSASVAAEIPVDPRQSSRQEETGQPAESRRAGASARAPTDAPAATPAPHALPAALLAATAEAFGDHPAGAPAAFAVDAPPVTPEEPAAAAATPEAAGAPEVLAASSRDAAVVAFRSPVAPAVVAQVAVGEASRPATTRRTKLFVGFGLGGALVGLALVLAIPSLTGGASTPDGAAAPSATSPAATATAAEPAASPPPGTAGARGDASATTPPVASSEEPVVSASASSASAPTASAPIPAATSTLPRPPVKSWQPPTPPPPKPYLPKGI